CRVVFLILNDFVYCPHNSNRHALLSCMYFTNPFNETCRRSIRLFFQFFIMFTIIGFEFENDFTIIENDEIVETINRDDYFIPYIDEPFINQSKIKDLLNQLKKDIYLEPVDATLNDQGEIIKEKLGQKIDERQFLNNFYESVYDRQVRGFKLTKEPVYPKVDSEILSEIKQVKLGEFSTYFETGNKALVHNIELGTIAINNYVLFLGEIFSFNKVLGQITVEKGYKKAPVIVKGGLSEDIGGGICQVSSTLYNAIDIKGVKVLE